MTDSRIAELFLFSNTPGRPRVLLAGPAANTFQQPLKGRAETLTSLGNDQSETLDNSVFDSVWLCNPSDNYLHLISEKANSLLGASGTLFIFLTKSTLASHLSFSRQFQAIKKTLVQHGLQDVRLYGIAPSLEDVRLVVPLGNRRTAASSLALYQPSLKTAKLRKAVAYSLSLVGLSALWTPCRFICARQSCSGKQIVPHVLLKRIYGSEAEIALFTGTPGYYCKPTIQVMSLSGKILGYCKIARTPQTIKLIEHEAEMLRTVNKLELTGALLPEIHFFGDIDNDIKLLLQSTSKTPFSSSSLVPNSLHVSFLSSLFHASKVPFSGSNLSCEAKVLKRIKLLKDLIPDSWESLLNTALTHFVTWVKENKITMSIAHRDFTPWNTFEEKNKLFVFDWEFAEKDWPPLVDALHFVIQKSILVNKSKPDKILLAVQRDSTVEGSFLSAVISQIGLHQSSLLPLLGFYLCDIITTYLKKNFLGTMTGKDDQRLIESWIAMLSKVTQSLGSNS